MEFILGIDINENETDMCRFDAGVKEPVSVIASFGGGREAYPTVLAFLPSSGEWKVGYEAENLIEKGEAVAVPYFFRKCMKGEEFRHSGKVYTAAQILAEFLRLSIAQTGVEDPVSQVRSLVVTVSQTGREIAQTAEQAFAILGFTDGRAHLIDHAESFFFQTFRSSAVYKRETALYHFAEDKSAEFLLIGSDGTMIPYTVSVHEKGKIELPEDEEEKDERFAAFAEETLSFSECTAIFLVGPGFDRSWAKKSLNVLCKGARKVYYASSLFSRGACYAAMDWCGILRHNDIRFIGDDLVTENIGMDMKTEGEYVFVQIINAGTHWYEADKEVEFLLGNGNEIDLKATGIRDGSVKRIRMVLDGLPKRPPKTTRIRLRIRYIDTGKCVISAEDLGFGELFPATHKVWEEVLG